MKKVKHIIKDCIPPILLQILQYTRNRNNKSSKIEFVGNYKSWEDAYKECTGYDSDNILEKTKNALLKVKRGEAVYERDSVLFDEIQYSWPLLAGLLKIASENNNRLSVLDFGGSLGSSYFQNREMLSGLDALKWSIVEQPHFVACGKKYFQSSELVFYDDLNACVSKEYPDVLIASGVLQYLEKPFVVISQIIDSNFKWIIIDRTPFLLNDEKDLLTVQKVPPSIYDASYPAWFFNEKKILNCFKKKYSLVGKFHGLDKANIPSKFLCLIFRLCE